MRPDKLSAWLGAALAVSTVVPLPARQQPAQLLALTGATVIDVGDGLLRAEQTIIIRGERIERVGSADTVSVPSGARVIDAAGSFAIPGSGTCTCTRPRALTGISRSSLRMA